MRTISDIRKKYQGRIDFLDLEILIAHVLDKTREFVLSHPEYDLNQLQIKNLKLKISRRMRGEPIAYILGHKEFYGLDFLVNKHTLVPRPETELLVDQAIQIATEKLEADSDIRLIDLGTGSGNIIISIAKTLSTFDLQTFGLSDFLAIDISNEALKIAKKNAKVHGLDKKIKFLHGSLLDPLIKNLKLKIKNSTMIIVANLPYLSKDIYESAPIDVKKYEPKSALFSPEQGLQHYRKLLEQIKQLLLTDDRLPITVFLEISPEQKNSLTKIIRSIHPSAKIDFTKDLAGKWRICKIKF